MDQIFEIDDERNTANFCKIIKKLYTLLLNVFLYCVAGYMTRVNGMKVY